MRREFMTRDEVRSQLRLHGVRSQLRLHGIADFALVERACIEPNGMISVLRRDSADTEPVEPPEAL